LNFVQQASNEHDWKGLVVVIRSEIPVPCTAMGIMELSNDIGMVGLWKGCLPDVAVISVEPSENGRVVP
jgi:hypothetical protein